MTFKCVSKIAQRFHSLSKRAEAGHSHGQASRKPSHVGKGGHTSMAALTGSPYGALGRRPLTPLLVGGFNTLLKPTPARMEVRAHKSRAAAATDRGKL